MALGQLHVLLGHLDQLLKVNVKRVEFLFGKIFDIDQSVAGAFHRRNYFVELDMNRLRVLILRALNQKDHQEGYYRRAGVNYKLPGVRVVKQWPGNSPDDNRRQRENERHGRPGSFGCLEREPLEDLAKLVAFISHSCRLRENIALLYARIMIKSILNLVAARTA